MTLAMTRFAYRVIDAQGRAHVASATAASADDLERRLRRQGLLLVRCRERRAAGLLPRRAPATRAELARFCLQLSHLYGAGIGLVDCLASLREGDDRFALRHLAASLAASIEAGSSLAEACESRADVFDPVFVALLRAGEQSGRLEAVLESLADDLRWRDGIARASRQALAYPALVLAVVAAALAGMLIFLVPPLASVFQSISPQLPPQTELLLAASAALSTGWPMIAAVPLLIAIVLVATRANGRLRAAFDRATLRLPGIGTLRMRFALARLAACFALTYRSGISVLDSLRLCESLAGPHELREAVRGARRAISAGRSLSQAFADAAVFPPLVLRMLQVGESSGKLDDALEHVSAHYSRSAREAVATLQALIGPATTVVVGAVVGAVVYAVLLPLYDVIGRVSL